MSNIRKQYELVRVKAKKQAVEDQALKNANPSTNPHEQKEQHYSGDHHNKHQPQNKRCNEQNGDRGVKKVKQTFMKGLFRSSDAHL
ncbi:hypothetical protein DVH05_015193 [Phytophthora capsici]|nr:hypothetical protein DVH05_015193 [Phytophthora capsici]